MNKNLILRYVVMSLASMLGYGAMRYFFGEPINAVILESVIFGVMFGVFFGLYDTWDFKRAQKIDLDGNDEGFLVMSKGKKGRLFLTNDQLTFKGTSGKWKKSPLEIPFQTITNIDFKKSTFGVTVNVILDHGHVLFTFIDFDEADAFKSKMATKN